MSITRGGSKIGSLLTTVFVFAIGVLITVVCSLKIAEQKNDKSVYIETEGTITSVSREYVGGADSDDYEYTVLIRYEVNGTEYRDVEYGSYKSSMKEGDTVKILYSEDDPSKIRVPGSEKVAYILLVAGIAVILVGVFMFFKYLNKRM